MKSPANIEKTVAVFSQSGIFKGLDLDAQRDLAEMAVTKQYACTSHYLTGHPSGQV
jgi:hypothetical protein